MKITKEKAEELIVRFCKYSKEDDHTRAIDSAKMCAKIAIEEILNYSRGHNCNGLTAFWEEVSKEIQEYRSN